MKTKHVVVIPYSPEWKTEFIKIKAELQSALGDSVLAIEHVGSTSVEGLAAKPIIDIDIVIESYDDFQTVRENLESIGYSHEGDLGVKDREAFKYLDKPHLMRHHLYVCPKDSMELKRHIAFRNFLRMDEHQEDRSTYGNLKLELAKRFPYDIDSYMAGKDACVKAILSKCGFDTEEEK